MKKAKALLKAYLDGMSKVYDIDATIRLHPRDRKRSSIENSWEQVGIFLTSAFEEVGKDGTKTKTVTK